VFYIVDPRFVQSEVHEMFNGVKVSVIYMECHSEIRMKLCLQLFLSEFGFASALVSTVRKSLEVRRVYLCLCCPMQMLMWDEIGH
jgi:hypothetical protein